MPLLQAINLGPIRNSHLAVGAISASVGIAIYSIYKWKANERQNRLNNVYETTELLNEYLTLHYALPHEILRYDFGMNDALDFPKRCAEVCLKYFKRERGVPCKALDIGCAVGRSTFELAKEFEFVMGIDYSHSFINAANHLKSYGSLDFEMRDEGVIFSPIVARVDPSVDRGRVLFQQGDACCLPSDIGQFGCVLAANLICRLNNPKLFINRLCDLVIPNGIIVITSPYNWCESYTPKVHWIGGLKSADQKAIHSFNGLQALLQPHFDLVDEINMPFLIRETMRVNQWTVSHTSIWRRR